jgi:hypothetical protein
VVVELKAGNVRYQRPQKRLALNQRQTCRVAAVEMQKVKGVVDQPDSALAIACRLSLREAWQSIITDAAQFSVEIGAVRPHIREGGNDAGIFVAPFDAVPRDSRPSMPAAK